MDIVWEIIFSIFYGIGALIFWLLKGCKTSFKNEIKEHKYRNAFTGVFIFILPFVILFIYNNMKH